MTRPSYQPQIQFPCVCGKACTAGKTLDAEGKEDGVAVTHATPACDVYEQLEADEFLEVCRKKLQADLDANPGLKPS